MKKRKERPLNTFRAAVEQCVEKDKIFFYKMRDRYKKNKRKTQKGR